MKKIVLTGGKFNKIHPGHIWLLKKAKKLGFLVVVLANDNHNKRSYALSARTRKKNLEALKLADKVVIGDPKSFVKVVKKFNPAVIILGYDQQLPKDTVKFIADEKIKVVRSDKHGDYETKKL